MTRDGQQNSGQDVTFGLPNASIPMQPNRGHTLEHDCIFPLCKLSFEVTQLKEALNCKPFSSEFFPTRELEEAVGKHPHLQHPARKTFPSTDFPQTEYFYTSARAKWNSFTPSDSENPAVDSDQTHVVIMKGGNLHPGIKTQHYVCCVIMLIVGMHA